jgi:hypothetical protein
MAQQGMQWRSRALATAGVCAVIGLGVSGTAAAAAHVVSASDGTPVNPATPVSHRQGDVQILASDRRFLVYGTGVTSFRGDHSAIFDLHVRRRDGHTRRLGPIDAVAPPSLCGAILTYEYDATPFSGGLPRFKVRWWNLASGASGQWAVPTHEVYRSCAPGGWLLIDRKSGLPALERVSTAGVTTPLPVRLHRSDRLDSAQVGPDGVVLTTRSGRLRYLRWSHPNTIRTLRGHLPPDQPQILAITSKLVYASSESGRLNGTLVDDADTIVFLDGTHKAFEPADYIRAHHLTDGGGYADFGIAPWGIVYFWSHHMWTLPTHDGVPRRSAVAVYGAGSDLGQGGGLAYGLPVVWRAHRYRLIQSESGRRSPSFRIAPRARVEALNFGLTVGRVAWVDGPGHGASLSTRTVGPSLGPTSVLDRGPGLDAVAASGALTAYATQVNGKRVIRVVAPSGDATVDGGATELRTPFQIQASGDRVLFVKRRGPKHRLTLCVFNLRTRNTRSIPAAVVGQVTRSTGMSDDAALWGDDLSYTKADGSIWRLDLATNKQQQVLPPSKYVPTDVYEWGDWVGWRSDQGSGWQDVATMSAPVNLTDPGAFFQPNQLLALTSNGALYARVNAGGEVGVTGFYLQAFGSTHAVRVAGTAPLLPDVDMYDAIGGPQIEGSIEAWESPNGVIREAALAHVADQPRYLGDLIAPNALAASAVWRAYVPFSAALSSCTVRFSVASTVVATRACNPSLMRTGDAWIRWDGRDTAGTPVSGPVQWTLTAANADGPAELANGTVGSLSGTIDIG